MKCLWDNCGKEAEDLKVHMEEHISEASEFFCKWEDCSKKDQKMGNKSAFSSHLRSHGECKTFKCSKCDKIFGKTDALNKHMKRHEADDKDVQHILDKSFYISDLREQEEIKTIEMLRERQLEVNCHRILHLFLDNQETDNWNNYL